MNTKLLRTGEKSLYQKTLTNFNYLLKATSLIASVFHESVSYSLCETQYLKRGFGTRGLQSSLSNWVAALRYGASRCLGCTLYIIPQDCSPENNHSGEGGKGGFGFLFWANPKPFQKWKGKIICFGKCSWFSRKY